MKKTLKTILIVVAVVAGLTLICSVAATMFVNHKASEIINRQVSASYIVVNPVFASVSIHNFHAKNADDSTAFVDFDKLAVRINPFSLAGKHINIRKINLVKPDIHIIDQDTCFNFSDLLTLGKKDTPDTLEIETPDSTAKPWSFSFHNIRLKRGRVSYTHQQQCWPVDNINIHIPSLSLDKPASSDSVSSAPGGEEYAGVSFSLPDDGGRVILSCAYNAAELSLSPRLTIENLNLSLPEMNTAIQGRRFFMNGRIQLRDMKIDVEQIFADKFHIRYIREPETKKQEAKANESTDKKGTNSNRSTLPDIRIASLKVDSSCIDYSDKTLFSDFDYTLSYINITGQNIDLNGKHNKLTLKAMLNHGGVMFADWQGALIPKKDNARLVAILRNVQLKDLSPWTEYMFAYPIENGTLSVTSDNSIISGQIDAIEKIDIHKLTLGKKKKKLDAEMKNIPIKLGIELLSDVNDNISLVIPINGDFSSPEFSYGKAIMRAIGNAMSQTAVSGKSDKMPFDLLRFDFTSEQFAHLDQVAEQTKETNSSDSTAGGLNMLYITQCFNLEDAINDQAVFNLKRYFYENQSQKTGRLSPVDFDNILAIKDNNKDFVAFVKPFIGDKGKLTQRAVEYYGRDELESQVLEAAQHRNEFVLDYLVNKKGVRSAQITKMEQDSKNTEFKFTITNSQQQ